MLGVYVSVPVASFRRGLAREYLETECIPPPATCYGFLLSLVGEAQRLRHEGARVTCSLLNSPPTSVVLRTVWRIKEEPLGSGGNTRPDYQQLLTAVELVVWLDSSEEQNGRPTLECRVREALDPAARASVKRFGGLSLGESTHLVDVVTPLTEDRLQAMNSRIADSGMKPRTYLLAKEGLLTLPVWVDHVGARGTVYVVGDMVEFEAVQAPEILGMPRIMPSSVPP